MHSRTLELLAYLEAQRAVLRDAFEAVPPDLRDTSPGGDRWSAAGIVEHLAIVEQRVGGLLAAKISAAKAEGLAAETSTEPILPTMNTAAVLNRSRRVTTPDAGAPTGLTAEAAWQALEIAGATVRDALASGDGFSLGTVMHPHPLFGPMSAYAWFGFLAAHEARHAEQIREGADALRAKSADTAGAH